MRVHLVDGTYELFRCFHGAPRATSPDGTEVGAVRGLLATLVGLLNLEEVTHIAVAFDSVLPPPGVRSPAKAAEAVLASQVGLAADVVRSLGVALWPSGRYSADELLATGSRIAAEDDRVERVVICTTDLDLAQCIRGDRVVLLDRTRKKVTTESDVIARFGVAPAMLADLFALVGDRSDGIAGLRAWGVRSAAAVLSRYGTVDAIPLDAAEWGVAVRGAARLAASLAERRAEAIIARDVLKLRDDVAITATVDDLAWAGARRAPMEALAARLGYDDPLRWLHRWRD